MTRFATITRLSLTKLILSTSAALFLLAAQAVSAQVNLIQFDLHVNPKFAACLGVAGGPAPTAHVTVKRGPRADTLTIEANNIRPHLAFDMFTIQRSNLLANGSVDPNFGGSFGMAWYQSDLQANGLGHFKANIKTILLDQIFGFDPDAGLAPTNTFHVGFWFNDPHDANKNGCTFDVTHPTPFNGEHKAGPLAMISVPDAQTDLGPLCTDPNNNGTCNP
ncbi:MAG: hypothetical protein DMG80_04040 [Acidobacteria bacterium]|jgi:hypothetical protein|nr:MAG: hypothetical protein DMG80_04040 [Acidobacteriota bacterium]